LHKYILHNYNIIQVQCADNATSNFKRNK